MIGPTIIYQLKEKDFSSKALKHMHLEMGLWSKTQVLDEILLCWIALASASVRIFVAEVESYDELEITISKLAKQLVKVWFYFFWLQFDFNFLLLAYFIK